MVGLFKKRGGGGRSRRGVLVGRGRKAKYVLDNEQLGPIKSKTTMIDVVMAN